MPSYDEHGGTAGTAIPEDTSEETAGDTEDEHDESHASTEWTGDNAHEVDGVMFPYCPNDHPGM